ncbi:MAG: GntR family transcriptional regulator [Oscillospiraceae bacterium]|nr:GntR family transcriptional regulator [Oscillospiraceae bacterium]
MIQINFRDSRPLYEQVKDSFRQMILSGVLPADYRMPSVRELAASLTINPNTIQRAYRELEAEGYICSVPGRGSVVLERSGALESRKLQLRRELEERARELRQLGVTREELIRWLEGGDEHDPSEGVI